MKLETIISLAGLFLTLLALLANYFGVIAKIKEGLSGVITTVNNSKLPELTQRLASLETLVGSHGDVSKRLAQLETRVELLWGNIEANLVTALHHPTTPVKDDLLERFRTLTVEEMCKLKDILLMERGHLIKGAPDYMSKVLAYSLMIARIDDKLMMKNDSCKRGNHNG